MGNKIDLYEDQKVDNSKVKEFANKIGAIFQLTSAKKNDGIPNLFDNIGKKYLEPNYQYDEKDNLAKENYAKKKEGEENNTRIRIKMEKNNNSNNKDGANKNGEKGKKGCC